MNLRSPDPLTSLRRSQDWMVPSSSRHGSQTLVGTPAWLRQALGCHLLQRLLLLADGMSTQLWRALGCRLLQKLLCQALGCHLLQKLLLRATMNISSQHRPACTLRISRAKRQERLTGGPGQSSFQQSTARCWQLQVTWLPTSSSHAQGKEAQVRRWQQQVTQVPTSSSRAQGEEAQPVLLSDQAWEEDAKPVLLSGQHQPQPPAVREGELLRACSTLRASSASQR